MKNSTTTTDLTWADLQKATTSGSSTSTARAVATVMTWLQPGAASLSGWKAGQLTLSTPPLTTPQKLREIEAIFENALACQSGPKWLVCLAKKCGKKSRDTVPFRWKRSWF